MFSYPFFKKRLNSRRHKYVNPFSVVNTEMSLGLIKRLFSLDIRPKKVYLEGVFCPKFFEIFKSKFPNVIFLYDKSQNVDLILSNSVIHLTDNLSLKLKDYHKILCKKGTLLFSTFGPNTLNELVESWKNVDHFVHVNQMLDIFSIGNLLVKNNFINSVVDGENFSFRYKSLEKIISDIRQINQPLSDTNMLKGLTTKHKWSAFHDNMNKKRLSVTYEFLYGLGFYKEIQSSNIAKDIYVPIKENL